MCSVFKKVWSCVRLCHVFSLRYRIACSSYREQTDKGSPVFPTNEFHVFLSPHLPFSQFRPSTDVLFSFLQTRVHVILYVGLQLFVLPGKC